VAGDAPPICLTLSVHQGHWSPKLPRVFAIIYQPRKRPGSSGVSGGEAVVWGDGLLPIVPSNILGGSMIQKRVRTVSAALHECPEEDLMLASARRGYVLKLAGSFVAVLALLCFAALLRYRC